MVLGKPQPAKGVLAVRRIPIVVVARQVGMHEIHVGRLLNGHRRPSAKFRRQLSLFLDLPESALFHETPARLAVETAQAS